VVKGLFSCALTKKEINRKIIEKKKDFIELFGAKLNKLFGVKLNK
jgi:hypothetical protein